MLNLVQIISFEIGQDCNLVLKHKDKCPISLIKRTDRELTDDIIINNVVEAYTNLGFEGFISWSFYNEPMIHSRRFFMLMEKIRSILPQSRFLLWTNGTILIEDKRMDMFEQIFVTNYTNKPVEEIVKCFGQKVFFKNDPQLDTRLNHYGAESKKRCKLPFDSFIISNTGEAYICCHDWKNEIVIGNIFDTSLKELTEKRWEYIQKICGKEMTDDAPKACLSCDHKWWPLANFDERICNKILYELHAGILSK